LTKSVRDCYAAVLYKLIPSNELPELDLKHTTTTSSQVNRKFLLCEVSKPRNSILLNRATLFLYSLLCMPLSRNIKHLRTTL